MNISIEEARGFADGLLMYAKGLAFIGETYQGATLRKSYDIINSLCDMLDGDATCGSEILTREKNEGEEGKRDIPPTPPIERKGEEGEEKREHTYSACAREAEIEDTDERIKREIQQAKELFEAFWRKYPTGHKHDKKNVRKKIVALYLASKDKASFINSLLGGLDKWIDSKRWSDGYICAPKVFLNQERWLCEPEKSASAIRAEEEERRQQSCAESTEALRKLGL